MTGVPEAAEPGLPASDTGPVRLRLTGVVAGSAGVFSSVERVVQLTDTHILVSTPSRVSAGYDTARGQGETGREKVDGDAMSFELGSVSVSFESGFLRSKLRIGDLDLRIRPLDRGKARKLAELARRDAP